MAADRIAELEAELERRGAILEAVRLAAEHFLDPVASWEDHLPEVLAALARATGTSRVYLFENYRYDDDGEVWATQRFEWAAPGVRSIAQEPDLLAMPMRGIGFGRWLDTFRRGEVIAGLRRDMLPEEQVQMTADETLSIVVVPIFVDGDHWGMLGFDECAYERRWSTGEIDALLAAARTIAAAIQADWTAADLRAREAEYRAVFEATSDGLVICDLEGRLVAANPAFCAMHGDDLDRLVGRPATSWVHSDHDRFRAEYTRLVDSGVGFSMDAIDVCRDGTRFPVEMRGSRLRFRGAPHVLLVVRDVTERARMRALLEERVRALSAVAESLTVDQPLEVMLTGLCVTVVEATDAVSASVQLVDGDTGALRVVGSHGLPDGYADALEAVSRTGAASPVTVALRAQAARMLREVREGALGMVEWAPLHPLLELVGWSDVLVVPLDTLGRSVGGLNIYYPAGYEPDAAERSFYRAIADQAAAAVENARLFEAAQGAAVLEERQRLARELHDSVSQALYGIGLGARTARSLLDRDPGRVAEPLDYVLNLAEAGLAEMRALIFELRPEALASEGLVPALERQLKALRARHQMEVVSDLGAEPDLTLDAKQALYRAMQEAVNNIVKHARATTVRVALTAGSDGSVRLEVADNGVGFDPDGPFPGHFGLQTMRERAVGTGGSFELTSIPGSGTTVAVIVPTTTGHDPP